MPNKLLENNNKGIKTSFILPVGPRGQYRIFAHICNSEKISCKNLITINMDEFLNTDNKTIGRLHVLSFKTFMSDNLFNLLDSNIRIQSKNIYFPDPGDIEKIGNLIKELGGADICFSGVGINGHVGFNEPVSSDLITVEEFKKLKTRILDISYETTIMTSLKIGGHIELVPRQCITVGIAEILASKEIKIYLEHDHQASVLEKYFCLRETPEVPVTVLRDHPNCFLTVSKNVLENYKRYRKI